MAVNNNRHKPNNRFIKKTPGDGRLLALGGIAIILVLIILIFAFSIRNRNAKARIERESIEESIRESESIRASIEESIRESEEAERRAKLSDCNDWELNELVKKYFEARQNGDSSALFEIFGRTDTTPDETMNKKLSIQAKWIRSFDNVYVYTIPGEDENSVIGVVKYKINFRRVSAKAPCIMYFYAKRNEAGKWYMCENILKETRDMIEVKFEESGVNNLIRENEEELRKLLSQDTDLALMYTSFINGEIYNEHNLDIDREQEVKLFMDPADSILIYNE
ncbi:MAG: hypothetical protein Q4B67_00455 [Eubacteriales bacterium]|nr:hypothetical protein [Eubacteriales bacterium]